MRPTSRPSPRPWPANLEIRTAMSSALATGTSTTPMTQGFTEAAFAAFLDSRDEPGWVADLRREAFTAFRATPIPTLRDEEWRRTDIRALKLDNFGAPIAPSPSPEARTALAPAAEAMAGHYASGLVGVDAAAVQAADPSHL